MASRGSSSSTNGLLTSSAAAAPRNAYQTDVEAGKDGGQQDGHFDETADDASSADPFDIANTKNVPLETLKRWRVSVVTTFFCVLRMLLLVTNWLKA